MPDFSPHSLADWTVGSWHKGTPGTVQGFCQDTRKLLPGQCFVALKTDQRDGHDYLAQAKSAGASCALVSCPIEHDLCQLVVTDVLEAFQRIAMRHRQTFKGKVVGITGSCGKTTTKDLLALLLGPRTLKTEGNLNNLIGVPLTLTRLDNAQHDFAVVEAGINEPGEMERLANMITADLSICTMVGPAHLEKLGSLEGVAREKSRIGTQARDAAQVLFPAECLRYGEFRAFGARGWVAAPSGVSYSGGDFYRIDYRTEDREVSGCRLLIESAALLPGEYDLPFRSPGLVSNAVLALTAAQLCGVRPKVLAERLQVWQPGAHRGQWYKRGKLSIYDDAYNANPASLEESLAAFVESAPTGQPRLFVLGGMKELGTETDVLHEKAAAVVPWRQGDRVVLVGEEASAYAKGLQQAGVPAHAVTQFEKTEEAAEALADFSGVVFLKGSRTYALEKLLDFIPQSEEAAC